MFSDDQYTSATAAADQDASLNVEVLVTRMIATVQQLEGTITENDRAHQIILKDNERLLNEQAASEQAQKHLAAEFQQSESHSSKLQMALALAS